MNRRTAPPPVPSPLLSGAYEYLTEGYYACQDAELAGDTAGPLCAETLDAYVVPIALEKAAKQGISVPDWVLTNEYFPIPAVCYGVNPFSRRYAFVRSEDERTAAAKRLTWNFKYTMCCQLVSATAELVEFRMVAGRTSDAELGGWADAIHRIFGLPVARVRLVRDGALRLSAIEALPWRSLTAEEREWARTLVRSDGG